MTFVLFITEIDSVINEHEILFGLSQSENTLKKIIVKFFHEIYRYI